ncbi:MAG: hypothetical protein WD066_17485 [Planctomycetaceae bacterium]
MIDESCYWKNDLLNQAEALRSRMAQRRWPEVSFARLEQTVMLGFYSIRKLIEASKLSNSTFEQGLPLTTYPWSAECVTRMNSHKLDQLYDFDSPSADQRDVLFLCHQIVHIFVFMPAFNEDGQLDAILFTSDRHRHQRLYSMTLHQIIQLFDRVGNDYPNEIRMVFNPDTQDYDVTATMHTDGNWA